MSNFTRDDGELSFADKIKTISVSKKRGAAQEKTLAADLAAYRRLRKEGLQPPSVDGAALLEQRSVTRQEIQTGVIKTVVPGEWKKASQLRREATLRGLDYEPPTPPSLPPEDAA